MSDALLPQTIKPVGQEAPNAQAVQGVTGGVPIQVQGVAGATSDVTLHDNAVTTQHLAINAAGQAATAPAVATAAAPTYTEGAQAPLSVDLAGALRTSAGAGGGLTDTQLRASPVPVSVSGVATAAKQDTGNTSLASIDGKLTNPLPISASSLPLPAGAATGAKQDTGNASLASIDAKLTNPLPVSATSLPLPTGAATAARQDTGNTSLASIDAKLTNPLPVNGTVTSNQGTAAAAASAWPIKVTDTSDVAVKPGDATNNAIRVNVVASSGSTTFFGITETPTGTINGTTGSDGNPTFTISHTPTDTPRVFVDGTRYTAGLHYTISGTTITFLAPFIPTTGATILVDYTWSLASATLQSVLVVDVNGNVQPTGDSASRPIHVTDDTLALAQGVAMAGAKGPMVQGVVSDTVAQFFNDVIQPLQLTADGRLRVQTASESNNFTPWGDPFDFDAGVHLNSPVSWG